MELKVWVEGIQRIVCGVSETTTCQDVVFALAHATGKIGRFTLIERWRNNERLLAPNENPLKILMKWGEYSHDVQFILQRSDSQKVDTTGDTNKIPTIEQQKSQLDQKSSHSIGDIPRSSHTNQPTITTTTNFNNFNNFNTLGTDRKPDLIGIVKGVQKQSVNIIPKSPPSITTDGNESIASVSSTSMSSTSGSPQKPAEFNSADIRNSLDRKTNALRNANDLNNECIDDNTNNNKMFTTSNSSELLQHCPPISSNGALAPPPYRNPPPPRSSPNSLSFSHQKSDSLSSNNSGGGSGYRQPRSNKFDFLKEMTPPLTGNKSINGKMDLITNDNDTFNDVINENSQFRDLLQLIKYQREKINSQQADITKYDAEIIYLENKERDQLQQIEAITREINKHDNIMRQGNEQLQALQYVDEENELVRQQEKTLKSEITLLRSKLANCETELLQCKNKIRLLMDDIEIEQRALNQEQDGRKQLERRLLGEVERIQSEIDQAIHNSESINKTTDALKKEVNVIETTIAEKKRQLEQLVNELKEVNLQSLAIAPSEEIRHLLEGSNRPGSTRRIMGSPRQLETAVPTSKNPHGVWV